MKSKPRNFLLPVAIAAVLHLTPHPLPAAQPKAGETFPALADFALEGKLPGDLKGKVLLVDFFASWCAPCKASFPALNELQAKYSAKGFSVIAVNVDEKRADMEAFLKKHPAAFPVVRDAKQKLVATAQVETMPTSFLIDAAGRVRFVHSGYHGEETKAQYMREIESLLNPNPTKP